ncbi:Cell division protein FtsI/penicillin-binding protein 2 [Gracilibacillus ureilyticus]|uniref:serine-type D-Ala-D-Ala carboxypeptidase n=1 Tax=Gracilibacillus ureilyticus TaxID=531814 RepID=A0A1H9M0Y3_9BACI|nr:penicillin-binding protein 2 [Gracilibacillus ureilyticus]SER17115.1 Cell division protein FtsI/penicillin-binding protein 2 [Gracilibacillus ureilyticus]
MVNQNKLLNKRKKRKKKAQLPFRLNILFVAVFLVFSLLIVQLGVVQIINGEEAQRQIDQTENTPSEKPVPRGKMYDRDHELVLDNVAVKSITYTPPKNGDKALDRLKLAEKLAKYVTIIKDPAELEKVIKERDKKEYFYLLNSQEVADRLSDEEKELEAGERYQAELEKITEADLNTMEWSNELLNILAIKKELDSAYELSPHVIVNEGITDEEYAKVAEHLYDLPGIDAAIDWERNKVYGETLSSFLGNITSADEGIPRENEEFYLANGYTRNDRVGTSGLEQYYEHVLRGRKEQVQYTTDSNGNVISSEVVVEGQRGKDLVLTIDMDLQEAMDQIVEEELRNALASSNNNGYLEDAMAVMMNPQTGEILGMSAIRYDRENNEFLNNSYRVIYDAHAPGSSIKGATVLAGYQSGVITLNNNVLSESPIKIKGSEEKKSHRNLGSALNDLQALQESSNIYMMRIAIMMSGATYSYNEPLYNFDWDTFDELRYYYNQFGLGVETGIDMPFESIGVVGVPSNAGNLLDFSFGQFDTYTTLQLAQYVSTIANEGYRVKPHLLKEIREPGSNGEALGPVLEVKEPEVLNRVEMDSQYIDRVQEGFKRVFTQGTASGRWSGFPYEVVGKTGTAENPKYKDGQQVAYTENLTLVGYSPEENPEIAFAVVVPNNGGTSATQHPVHHEIGKRIVSKYYELKENNGNESEDSGETAVTE